MRCHVVLFCFALYLLAPMPAEAHEGAEVLVKSEKSWDGSTLPAYPTKQPEVTILKVTVPPKSKLPWHVHNVISAGYLVSGELTVISQDGKELKLKQGDVLVELVGKLHYGRNDGDAPAVIVVFYAGAQDVPLTTIEDAEGEPLPHEHEEPERPGVESGR